jgi:hypothetical protein
MSEPTVDEILGKVLMHDHVAADISDADTAFLKLDQTTPQEIINGAPIFSKGLIIKAGERIYFDGN